MSVIINYKRLITIVIVIENCYLSYSLDFDISGKGENADVVIKPYLVPLDKNITLEGNRNENKTVCYREEIYTEEIRVPVLQPVRIRSSTWCLEFPPRCSNYKTETREIIKLQNVTKTRLVEFCCEGYTRITKENTTICKPICRGGCGRGYCQAPSKCKCERGFTGRYCTESCYDSNFNKDASCEGICNCKSHHSCHYEVSNCSCLTGWTGQMCEIPCALGFYGENCKYTCKCESGNCHPQTGKCFEFSLETENTVSSNIDLSANKPQAELIIPKVLNEIVLDSEYQQPATNKNSSTTNPAVLNVPFLTLENTIPSQNEDFFEESPPSVQVLNNLNEHFEGNILFDQNKRKSSFLNGYLSVFILILTIISVFCFILFIAYNYYLKHKSKTSTANHLEGDVSDTRHQMILIFDEAKPQEKTNFPRPEIKLPILPEFVQNLNQTRVPDFYDFPSNNSPIQPPLESCKYETNPYSVVTPNCQIEANIEHFYDEIKHPAARTTNF